MRKKLLLIIILLVSIKLVVYFLPVDIKYKRKEINVFSSSEVKRNDLNYIVFNKLLEKFKIKNKDVYGWLKVEGTKIDYPIVQHNNNDSYYLNHDVYNNKTIYGSIFTEKYNSKDFNDNFIIIYGHSMRDGSMFGTLEKYKKKEFFSKNKHIKIYYDEAFYIYEIVSAYSVDSEHFFSKYDLTSTEKVNEYYNMIEEIATKRGGNYRKTHLNNKDLKILTLSTCSNSYDDNRFVIQAILKKKVKIK